VIQYLIDSSALWRLLRHDDLREHWAEIISIGAVGACAPQRIEFLRSARSADDYEEMSAMFRDLYPDVSVPKGAWHWIESAQFRLARHGVHRALSAVDLLICATAALGGVVVLHDDGDFVAAAQHLADLRERNVHSVP
jgi:predicted nucleic acid-binding protein